MNIMNKACYGVIALLAVICLFQYKKNQKLQEDIVVYKSANTENINTISSKNNELEAITKTLQQQINDKNNFIKRLTSVQNIVKNSNTEPLDKVLVVDYETRKKIIDRLNMPLPVFDADGMRFSHQSSQGGANNTLPSTE